MNYQGLYNMVQSSL